MSYSEPHPGDDLLADLAAGQLSRDDAARVETHVLACAACGDLLAGAEEMRSLLRRQPVPPMPDDVAARLSALVGSAIAGTAPPTAGTSASAASARKASGTPAAGSEVPGDRTAPTRILRPVTGRRLTPLGGDSRRQTRTEERTDVRWGRWTSFARVAAGLVAVLVLGGGAIGGARWLRGPGGGGAGGGESAASDSGGGQTAAALSTPVLQTGRKYAASGLKAQVEALVADSRKDAAPNTASYSATASGELKSTSGEQLRSEAGLDACLRAIGRGDARAIAVDLASYQNREAAVIVLQQPDGSYEVWIVARDCRAGADGTIAVRTITP